MYGIVSSSWMRRACWLFERAYGGQASALQGSTPCEKDAPGTGNRSFVSSA